MNWKTNKQKICFVFSFLYRRMTSKTSSHLDKFEETLQNLNDSQQSAVLSNAQSLQILAGPGSGKTRGLNIQAIL
jgi:superfamily I DNA and RNA helicase